MFSPIKLYATKIYFTPIIAKLWFFKICLYTFCVLVTKFFCNVKTIAEIIANNKIKPAIKKWYKKFENSTKPSNFMFVNVEFKLQKLEFTVNKFVKSVKKYNELVLKLLKSSNSKLNNNKS